MHLKDCIEFYMCADRITLKLYTMCTQGGDHEEKKIANMHERMSAALFEKSTTENQEGERRMLLTLNIKNTCLLHITKFKPPESPVHTHGLI